MRNLLAFSPSHTWQEIHSQVAQDVRGRGKTTESAPTAFLMNKSVSLDMGKPSAQRSHWTWKAVVLQNPLCIQLHPLVPVTFVWLGIGRKQAQELTKLPYLKCTYTIHRGGSQTVLLEALPAGGFYRELTMHMVFKSNLYIWVPWFSTGGAPVLIFSGTGSTHNHNLFNRIFVWLVLLKILVALFSVSGPIL